MIPKPTSDEHSDYFSRYVGLVPGDDALIVLETQRHALRELFASLSDEQQKFRYAPNKWTPKDILLHIIDTERGMSYRAMCVARGDNNDLPSMDEDVFADAGAANKRTMDSLLEEYSHQRIATCDLFRTSIPPEHLSRIGRVNHHPASARALAWIIAGHDIHHCAILRSLYLNAQ